MNSPPHKVHIEDRFLWKCNFVYINPFLKYPSDMYAALSP